MVYLYYISEYNDASSPVGRAGLRRETADKNLVTRENNSCSVLKQTCFICADNQYKVRFKKLHFLTLYWRTVYELYTNIYITKSVRIYKVQQAITELRPVE